VFISAEEVEIGEVVAISPTREEVQIRFSEGAADNWFAVEQIYPAREPEVFGAGRSPNERDWSNELTVEVGDDEPAFAVAEQTPRRGVANIEKLKRDLLAFLEANSGKQFFLREIRSELGLSDYDAANPIQNPVHRALAMLRDRGDIHVIEPRFGEPRFSVLAPGQFPDELTGPEMIRLMQKKRVTISELSQRIGITQKRIREVRKHGLTGRNTVRDWMEAITGEIPS